MVRVPAPTTRPKPQGSHPHKLVRQTPALAADALRTADDGFRYVDTSKVPPSIAGAYSRLLQFGYANGLV